MTESSLRTARPTAPKEVASLSARAITVVVIAAAGVLSVTPFFAYLGN